MKHGLFYFWAGGRAGGPASGRAQLRSKIAANFRKSGKFLEFLLEECKFAILSGSGPFG
jgi:hypothetical protein